MLCGASEVRVVGEYWASVGRVWNECGTSVGRVSCAVWGECGASVRRVRGEYAVWCE